MMFYLVYEVPTANGRFKKHSIITTDSKDTIEQLDRIYRLGYKLKTIYTVDEMQRLLKSVMDKEKEY